jgi:hypothetical protein
MPPCHGGGRGFESRPVRRKKEKAPDYQGLFLFGGMPGGINGSGSKIVEQEIKFDF